MSGPLDGFRILDMTSVILGPYASQILGDLGADVIKIESPLGDTSRYVNPGRSHGMSGTAMNLHRNKRSIVLDLKVPQGREALFKLVETADALIHSVRPSAMVRLGITYEAVKDRKLDIIYCQFTGFGADGPLGGRPAYDDLIQGASGVTSLLAKLHGEPFYFPGTICDKIAGLTGVYALLAALLHRQRTGVGQMIEVPMLETMVSFNLVEHICDATFEPPLAEIGYLRMLTPNRRPFRTADGYLCVLPYTDPHWRAFFEIAGRPELVDDPRFKTYQSRTAHVDELYGMIADTVATKTTAEWLPIFAECDIPAVAVANFEDLMSDEHLRAKGFFEVRDHPTEGAYRTVGIPTFFSETPGEIAMDAPRLGEHSAQLLREVGYSEADVAAMQRDGVTSSDN